MGRQRSDYVFAFRHLSARTAAAKFDPGREEAPPPSPHKAHRVLPKAVLPLLGDGISPEHGDPEDATEWRTTALHPFGYERPRRARAKVERRAPGEPRRQPQPEEGPRPTVALSGNAPAQYVAVVIIVDHAALADTAVVHLALLLLRV
eukprot:7228127-Prymnesium_polylepis.1